MKHKPRSPRIENGILTLGEKKCSLCYGTGKYHPQSYDDCEHCNGTGKGPRGGRGGCKQCFGNGKRWVWHDDRLEHCDRCDGTGIEQQNTTSYVPGSLLRAIPTTVIRQERGISFNESLLGLGCFWSCQDYGRAWEQSDAKFLAGIEEELYERSIQACKFTRKENGTLTACHVIAFIINRGGYSIRPVYGHTSDVADDAANELDYETGAIFGTVVANAGGHGTLSAALTRKPRRG